MNNFMFKKDQLVLDWAVKHNLSDQEIRSVFSVPFDHSDDENSTEFYLKLENLGNKHFIHQSKEDLLIEWLKLTNKLFNE